jgi:hypothetical protein
MIMKKIDRAGCAALGAILLGLSAAICPFVSGAAGADQDRSWSSCCPKT